MPSICGNIVGEMQAYLMREIGVNIMGITMHKSADLQQGACNHCRKK